MEGFSDGGFACGLAADGLPVVEPKRASVRAMLGDADPEASLGACPPSNSACHLWRVAACAVLAGCEPRQFPLVVAAVRALLDDAGTRANACVGRALKLVLHHVGGASVGGTESTTIGTPAKYSACVGERDDVVAGGWGPYGGRGAPTCTLFPVTGMAQVVDFDTTDPKEVAKNIAVTRAHACWGARFPFCSSALVLVSPEHYKTLQTEYATRQAFKKALFDYSNAAIVPHSGRAAATLAKAKGASPTVAALAGAVTPTLVSLAGAFGSAPVPKFESPESIHVAVCGGAAGKFSMICAGFGAGKPGMAAHRMSVPVSRPVAALEPGTGNLPDGAVLDPRGATPPPLALAPRSGRLEGAVGLLDISKGGGKVFLDGIEAFLRTAFEGVEIRRYAKPTFSRNCPAGLLDDVAAACAHVARGLASVAVLSDAFPSNARAQAAQLGLPAAPAVFVAHPISDQTDAQLLARAEAIGPAVADALTTAAPAIPAGAEDAACGA
ncbi:hypothetical protein JL722_8057 [Aureococcus anophagefferens]|nr:hypothetical protein JL722_8057 [Aureococcus anophagefferens]